MEPQTRRAQVNNRRKNERKIAGSGWMASLVFLTLVLQGAAQPSHGAARKITIDVASMGSGSNADALRQRIVARLKSSGEVDVVDDARSADFELRGTSNIWATGTISPSPRSKSLSETTYGGYLSVELLDKDGRTLWSYLVMPSRMRWSGVVEDMADHMARLLLEALKQPHPPAAQSVPEEQGQIPLAGAGSTFAAPLYQAWIQSFEARRPDVRATYEAVGSENGVKQLEDGKVDFAASDVALTDAQMAAMPIKFKQYAMVLGGVVPAYNLAGVDRDLRFTPEILADIYLGKIKRWNDPRLRDLNRGAGLPDEPIVVLHRSDGSGTSFAWTEFLSRSSAEWKQAVGSGMRVSWPAGEGVEGNEAVAAHIAATAGAIGYVELTYAIRHELSFGLVRNEAGNFVQANLATLGAAAQAGISHASLLNATGKDAYPIATFTWILVPASADAKKAAALKDLLRWMLTDGQKECAGLGYVPLPKSVSQKQLAELGAALQAGENAHASGK
jgi:phosphate ABC transporter phosphate-binding protein